MTFISTVSTRIRFSGTCDLSRVKRKEKGSPTGETRVLKGKGILIVKDSRFSDLGT